MASAVILRGVASSTRRFTALVTFSLNVNRICKSNYIFIYNTLIMLSTICGCQSRESRPGEAFDAGSIFLPDAREVTHKFSVKNTTNKTVAITGNRRACTCTVATIDRVILKPGESTPLTMKVRLSDVYQEFSTFCVVMTDHPVYRDWYFSIRVRCLPRMRLVPNTVDLGAYNLDGTPLKSSGAAGEVNGVRLEVYGRRNETLPAVRTVEAAEQVEVNVGDPTIDLVDASYQRTSFPISFAVRAGENISQVHARPFRFALSDGTESALMAVWRSVGPLSIAPSAISFGLLDRGSQVRRAVFVKSSNGHPFRLLNVDSDNQRMTVSISGGGRFPSGSTDSHQIELCFDASALEIAEASQVLSGMIRFETDLPGARGSQIPWSAFIRRPRARNKSGIESSSQTMQGVVK